MRKQLIAHYPSGMEKLEKLLQFLQETPGDPFLRYAIALEYIKLDKTDTALEYFEDLVRKDPEYLGTYYQLGKLYQRLKRKEEALNSFKNGMVIARKLNDQHSLAELQTAYSNLDMGLDDE